MSAPALASEMRQGASQRKIRFALIDGVIVEQVLGFDDVLIHQEALRIVKSRNWVQIGCTRMDWATYDELIKQVGADA